MAATKKPRPRRASVTPPAPRKALASRPVAQGEGETGRAKPKLVRDSFTIPKGEYALIEALKLRAATLARPTKKSELLRAGIAVLDGLSDRAFLAALNRVPSLKPGRPKSSDESAG